MLNLESDSYIPARASRAQKEKYLLTGPNPGVQGGPVWRSNNWAKPSINTCFSKRLITQYCNYCNNYFMWTKYKFALDSIHKPVLFISNLHFIQFLPFSFCVVHKHIINTHVQTSQKHDKQFFSCAQLFPWKICSSGKSKIEMKLNHSIKKFNQ